MIFGKKKKTPSNRKNDYLYYLQNDAVDIMHNEYAALYPKEEFPLVTDYDIRYSLESTLDCIWNLLEGVPSEYFNRSINLMTLIKLHKYGYNVANKLTRYEAELQRKWYQNNYWFFRYHWGDTTIDPILYLLETPDTAIHYSREDRNRICRNEYIMCYSYQGFANQLLAVYHFDKQDVNIQKIVETKLSFDQDFSRTLMDYVFPLAWEQWDIFQEPDKYGNQFDPDVIRTIKALKYILVL